MRGNVNTRIRKLQDGEYDAIILACAGLDRLGLDGNWLPKRCARPNWLPAATQGTIGVQCREGDEVVSERIDSASAAPGYGSSNSGGAFHCHAYWQGSCQVPLAVFAQTSDMANCILQVW